MKKSDAGIAVAGATDAAKSAADIVLTKPGLSVIIDAIKESHKIFEIALLNDLPIMMIAYDNIKPLQRPASWEMHKVLTIAIILGVAGHLTICLTRTGENHFWSRPFPSSALFWAAEITLFVGVLFAVYGIFMKPIGWSLAAFV